MTALQNTLEHVICSGCDRVGGSFARLQWMYAGDLIHGGYGIFDSDRTRVYAHYFCSHECVHAWEAGNGARPNDQETGQ